MRHLIGADLDRLDHLRAAHDVITPETRVLTFDAEVGAVLVSDGRQPGLAVLTAAELDPGRDGPLILLGERHGVRWAARAAAASAAPGGAAPRPSGEAASPAPSASPAVPGSARFEGIRAAASSLARADAGLVVYGAGLLAWHRRARFCGACGGPTRSTSGGHQRECERCGAVQFPRTDPAVITLVRRADDRGDRCLLINQPRWPEDRFAAVAGFVEPGETLEQAVAREVAEEVGLELASVEYLASQPWPFPHSLMIAFRATAAGGEPRLGDEVRQARWFTRQELRSCIVSGEITLPTPFSISRSLVDDWLGTDSA